MGGRIFSKPAGTMAVIEDKVYTVTPDQVKKAAQTYLDPKLLRVAIVRGKNNTTGVALVEVYDLD